MADKRIQDLTPASSVGTADRFVLEQSGQAKSLTGQILINDLAAALDGHGGISDISYTAPSSGSLNGTLTITLADGTVSTLTVTNGRGISSISKTGTSGLVDTYTISYNNGTSSTFTVTNGLGVSSVTKTAGTGTNLTDTYTITYSDGSTYVFTLDNGKSISSVADKWAVSDSNSVVPSIWHNSPQTMTATNRYEWHYQIITFNDGTTINTDQAVVGVYGDTGDADHVYIKWSDSYPTQDEDMLNSPSNYIGVCTTTADSAPSDYTEYEWFLYKGATGDAGTSITSVTLDSSSGLVDTYKVLFDDNTYTTFNVTNGSDIDSITKTSSSGLTDTYTVLLTNGDATTFNVVNGKSITSITAVDVTHVAGHTDVYRINFNDGDTYSFSIYNGLNGSGSVSTVDGVESDGNQNVPLLILGSGAPTTTTTGLLKQRYFDQTNSNLYICTGIDTSGAETTYTWQGASSITVDSALSTLSTNPVQNAVLTTLLGTTTLNTTAQTLTGAVNELDAKIGSTALPTTAQTLTGAIAEHETDLSGKVSKSGDTMSGGLTITGVTGATNTSFSAQESTYSLSNLPSSGIQRPMVTFLDGSGTALGLIRGYLNSVGTSGVDISGRNMVSGSGVYNTLSLYITSDGTPTVVISDNAKAPWRSALGLGTSGVLPITVAQGGTGSSAVESTTTLADFATKESLVTVSAASYVHWGKLAMLDITFTTSAAASQTTTLFTLKSGCRPAITAAGSIVGDSDAAGTLSVRITTGGVVRISGGSMAASSAAKHFRAFYLLA